MLGIGTRGFLGAPDNDLAFAVAARKTGATTVAATMLCAHLADIRVFATGGIGGVHRGAETSFDISADLEVSVRVHLGPFAPTDVEVQLYHGLLDTLGEISDPQTVPVGLEPSRNGDATYLFRGRIPCQTSGQYGFSVRVLPKHPALPHSFEPGLVTWG